MELKDKRTILIECYSFRRCNSNSRAGGWDGRDEMRRGRIDGVSGERQYGGGCAPVFPTDSYAEIISVME